MDISLRTTGMKDELKRAVFACPACQTTWLIHPAQHGKRHICQNCHHSFDLIANERAVPPDEASRSGKPATGK